MSNLTKTETFLVIWLNIVALCVRLFPHTCAKTSMPLVSCIVSDSPVNAILNMQKTLFQFTTPA